MRTKIFIALLAIAIGMSACDWFKTSSPKQSTFDITGSWKLDSIKPGNDTVANSMWLAAAILAETKANDSANLLYEFRGDTLYSSLSTQLHDTTLYKFDSAAHQLTVFEAEAPKTFVVNSHSDSLISLTSAGSAVMYLRKL